MNHLIIYANHNDGTFNHAVKETIQNNLTAKGHQVTVRDLYQMDFNPVLSTSDLAGIHSGNIPDDIRIEQEFVKRADVITFVYPIWWTGLPAILKGYIDRVFSFGFAYGYTDNGLEGFLRGKKVVIFNTTGQPKELYINNGMYKAMALTSDTGIFRFCAMEVLEHVYFPSVLSVNDAMRQVYIESANNILDNLFGNIQSPKPYADSIVTLQDA
jgi:NAD(P)H dehydrogenase (quinone)